jgi:two-component system LytT family response regulator
MLRALIVDDEEPARRMIREYLEDFPQIETIGEAENGARAVEAIVELDPDLLLLDIQMPGLNGFEVLAEVGAVRGELPAVIFSTAYDDFALRAFEVNAVDYLLKPYDRQRFHTAVARVVQKGLGGRSELERIARLLALAVPRPPDAHPEFLMVRSGSKVMPVRAIDIEWIEAADNYALLHGGGESYIASAGIGELERRLNPSTFMRVHRSAIINVTLVRHLEPDGSGGMVATMRSGSTVKVSRTHAAHLRKMFV